MIFPRITASKLDLVRDCPGAAALPWNDRRTEWAAEGDAIHAYLEAALPDGADRAGALAAVPLALRDRCAALDLAALREIVGPAPQTEVAFVWDATTDTARILGMHLKRAYPPTTGAEIVGTVDGLSLNIVAGVVRTVDWKTGHQSVAAPDESLQAQFYALASARVARCEPVAESVVCILRDGAPPIPLRATFDMLALAGIVGELRAVLVSVQAARSCVQHGLEPEFHPGDCCTYCPAIAHCPAVARQAQALVPLAERVKDLTLDDAGRLWEALVPVERAIEMAKEALKARAAAGDVPLSNGKALRLVQQTRETLDAQVTAEVLENMGVANALTAMSTSKEAVARVLGHGRAEEALARIREQGGATLKAIAPALRVVRAKEGA